VNAQQFIDALRALEEDGEVQTIAELFNPEASLWNPQLGEPLEGEGGARQFWREYRDTFREIRSEFLAILEHDGAAALEWESRGVLAQDDQPIHYRGVSILEWGQDGIDRFAAYFDASRLVSHTAAPAGGGDADGDTSAETHLPNDEARDEMGEPAQEAVPDRAYAVGESYSRPLP
jgi:hypothetical protein